MNGKGLTPPTFVRHPRLYLLTTALPIPLPQYLTGGVECDSISTTEVAVTDITKGGFNGVKLVRERLRNEHSVSIVT